MAAQWPSAFQDYLNQAGFGYTSGETSVKSDVDYGPPKRRQRFTRAINNLSVQFTITRDLKSQLDSFFYDTLGGGTLAFEFDDPFDDTLKEYKMDAPTYATKGGKYFDVSMVWGNVKHLIRELSHPRFVPKDELIIVGQYAASVTIWKRNKL